MRAARLVLAATSLLALLFVGFRDLGPLPPLGQLVDPYRGVWAQARVADLPRHRRAELPGLEDTVLVIYDDRAVPHIFARSELDAYRALGYVVARDRLFQLEIQTRATAGTLTEWLGPRLLETDRAQRSLGLAWSAEREWAALDSTTLVARAVRAYAEGVNAWIAGLRRRDLPLEYHLLGKRPMRWKPQYSLYLMKRMGYTLAFNTFERVRERLLPLIGDSATSALFPIHSPIQEPVEPGPGPYPRFDWRRLPPPAPLRLSQDGRGAESPRLPRSPDGETGPWPLASLARSELPRPRMLRAAPHEAQVTRSAQAPWVSWWQRVPVGPVAPGLNYPEADDEEAAGSSDRGSNNWAVSPRRTARGAALLAGDPHLELTLPSIWYEVHLVVHPRPPQAGAGARPATGTGPAVPRTGTAVGTAAADDWNQVRPAGAAPAGDSLDVYGVTIPGLPGVVIGFNRNVAWSFTNTENDVLDLYAEVLDHPAQPQRYLLDGTWRPLTRRLERYLGRHGEVLAAGTIYHTHRGPLALAGDRATSLRWLVLEAGGAEGLLRAQHAANVDQWLEAMQAFKTPAQNGVVADRAGNIAIRSLGAFPLRPGDGRGDRVRDGTASASDWIGFWPAARQPYARNPTQGFLVSANQEPKDPRVDPGYLRANWPAPWRAMRINQLLRADSAVTVDAMRRYQTDPGSARADALVPVLLRLGRQALERGERADSLAIRRALDLLCQWDRRYTKENTRAVFFEFVMRELQDRLWDELSVPAAAERTVVRAARVATPSEAVLLEVLQDSTSPWWDDRRTEGLREDRLEVVARSLAAAFARALEELGDPADTSAWRWSRVRQVNIYHLLRAPSLSVLGLPIHGGPSTINPSSGDGTSGASWRMVVELGPEVRGFGVYPGGQSGNPVSPWYADRIPRWVEGQLDTLRFPRSPGELDGARQRGRLLLLPGRSR